MRNWTRSGFALLFGSGLLALVQGGWQPSQGTPLLQREIMGFALLNNWAVCFPILGLIFFRPIPPPRAFWLGIGVGACPLLLAWLHPAAALSSGATLALLSLWPKVPVLAPPNWIHKIGAGGMLAFLLLLPWLPTSSTTLSPNHYQAADDTRPLPQGVDVFLISVDTLRADAIVDDPHTPGDSTAPTPFLDAKRHQSLWADYALSSSNQTLPGHLGMLTGSNAMQHGVRSNRDLPDPNLPYLATIFQQAGWHTSGVIANALLSAVTGLDRGYDVYSDQPIGVGVYAVMLTPFLKNQSWAGLFLSADHTRLLFQRLFFRHQPELKNIPLADRVRDVALQQLDANYAQPRPFFQFIHFMDPHTAYRPPAATRGTLSSELKSKVAAKFLPPVGAEISVEMVRELQKSLQQGDADAPLAARYYHQVYLEEVAYVDQQLQTIFERADASGRPYVVLFTGDHGEQFAEHQYMDHANSMYEKNLEVPFQLWGFGVVPGHLENPPHSADVAPTLLQLAGIPIPKEMTGQVVKQNLPARAHVAVDAVEVAIRSADGQKWVQAWKRIGENDFSGSARWVDLANDPQEQMNLLGSAALNPNLQNLIERILDNDTWQQRQSGHALSASQQAALGALGYANQDDDRL